MTRASNTPVTRRRRKKVLKQAKGYFGSKHKLFKTAKEQLMNSYAYAYRDRKQKKRDFRKLWILRINNSCRENGTNYSTFIRMLVLSHIKINRKQISEMCINNPDDFRSLLNQVTTQKSLQALVPSVS